ncbi:MAG TPA: multifunctional oxoglutarate decarboxylase/oxoglutarate dehydrogenase thiamine pyrophosphate-binding subunit/dihydrolipoyllysine-residue succinyltransferase subunit, partial [Actinomycetota bacterium]|nr:multifunctional oxoglutarate decarboxylase/oxoglutarate dehydrogenase thiamine pyrophosphate-binding subunit/dihydrolipoyllysine-residue succinyltransferase subunit [Actinomycetota bacterium]
DALVCWEAQFGDFINGAQIVVDEFIVAGEDKWSQESGLVMLLPHGYEGQGPDHSSARLERFLTLSAEESIQVVQPTTAAQYFHVLRRQLHRSVRKPLIVMTPKWLLRLPDARSKTSEFTKGHFRETIDDVLVDDPAGVKGVLLSSGKVAYQLAGERAERDAPVAVVRVEQLYPFPSEQILALVERYPNAKQFRWVQDEPENMGAWAFVHAQLGDELRSRDIKLSRASRFASASPATGSQTVHEQEQQGLLDRAFRGF